MFIYFRTLNYFREVARETKRLESISRSPVFAHFSETLGGLSTIRSYNQANRFISDFELKVDENTRASYNNNTGNRWLSVRLEGLCVCMPRCVCRNGATTFFETGAFNHGTNCS